MVEPETGLTVDGAWAVKEICREIADCLFRNSEIKK
jgi:hypothetical protein